MCRSPLDLRHHRIPGGNAGGATPVPISNTAVNPSWADGTALVTVWESRSLPGVILEEGRRGNRLPSLLFPRRGDDRKSHPCHVPPLASSVGLGRRESVASGSKSHARLVPPCDLVYTDGMIGKERVIEHIRQLLPGLLIPATRFCREASKGRSRSRWLRRSRV